MISDGLPAPRSILCVDDFEVICSTIIDAIETHCKAEPSSRLAYYYFDFSDTQKQTVLSCLQSAVY